MLIELDRAADGGEVGQKLAVNPTHVAAVHDSMDDGVVIVRLADGRGYKVSGTYAEVMAKVNGAGGPHQG